MAVLKITRKKHILRAEIDRRETLNAIDFQVITELEEALDEMEENEDIRVFILRGAGDEYFVSGGDLKDFSGLKTADEGMDMARRMTTVLERIENGRFWAIACINGDVYGGGCELMLAFDFSISRKTAKFGFTQGKFGLPPGWGGLTRLVERAGRSRALEWLGSQSVISADTAFAAGLVNRLSITSDLEDNTWRWAEKLAKTDRKLIYSLKQASRNPLKNGRSESLEAELREFGRFWEHEEHHKRVREFLDKATDKLR